MFMNKIVAALLSANRHQHPCNLSIKCQITKIKIRPLSVALRLDYLKLKKSSEYSSSKRLAGTALPAVQVFCPSLACFDWMINRSTPVRVERHFEREVDVILRV